MNFFQNYTTRKLEMQAAKTIKVWETKHGQPPRMRDIRAIPAFSTPKRIGFAVLGTIFLYVSWLFFDHQAWGWMTFFLIPSSYVACRGFFGHSVAINCPEDVPASTSRLMGEVHNKLTRIGWSLLCLDACFMLLWIILELVGAAGVSFSG